MKIKTDFFSDPSLVLCLPLRELDGASFASRDACGHLCTATGALWRLHGRYFDSDNKIDCGSSSLFAFTSGSFTIEAWIYCTATEVVDIVVRNDTEATNGYFFRIINDGRLGLRTSQAAAGQVSYSDFGTVSLNAWQHAVATRIGASVKLYGNGSLLAYQAGQEGTHVNPAASSLSLRIGLQVDGSRDYVGTIGEVRIYNRALSAGEIAYSYNQTKGRYV